MRKFIYFLVFSLTPILVSAKNNAEKIFTDEAKQSFWKHFFSTLLMFLPYLIGLIIFKFVLDKVLKFLKDKTNKSKK